MGIRDKQKIPGRQKALGITDYLMLLLYFCLSWLEQKILRR